MCVLPPTGLFLYRPVLGFLNRKTPLFYRNFSVLTRDMGKQSGNCFPISPILIFSDRQARLLLDLDFNIDARRQVQPHEHVDCL